MIQGKERNSQRVRDINAIVGEVVEKVAEKGWRSSLYEDVVGFPGEDDVRSFEVTVSLKLVWFPGEVWSWCTPDSQPGIRIRKQLKNFRQPDDGWEVVFDRVALRGGEVNRKLGSYEKVVIDLSSGEMRHFKRSFLELKGQERQKPQSVYETMLGELLNSEDLVSASFTDRDFGKKYELIPIPRQPITDL
jgi:hypothetical protein